MLSSSASGPAPYSTDLSVGDPWHSRQTPALPERGASALRRDSLGGRAGSASLCRRFPFPPGCACFRLSIFVKKVRLNFFPKAFKNSKCTLLLFIYNLLISCTYLSVHLSDTTTAFPTSCFMCLLIPNTSLTLVAP